MFISSIKKAPAFAFKLQSSTSCSYKAAKRFSYTPIVNSYHKMLSGNLKDIDNEMYTIIKKEETRQKENLCLIASENFISNSGYQA